MKNIKSTLLIITILLASACTSVDKPKLCNEKVIGEGPCMAYYEGYEFDPTANICIKKGVSGCVYKTPFKTLEKCQNSCE